VPFFWSAGFQPAGRGRILRPRLEAGATGRQNAGAPSVSQIPVLDVQRIASSPPAGRVLHLALVESVSIARFMTRLEQFVTPACNSLKTRNI
jgi:hypothetical protein